MIPKTKPDRTRKLIIILMKPQLLTLGDEVDVVIYLEKISVPQILTLV